MTSVCPVCFQGIAFADMILSKPSDAISSDQPSGMFSITYVWISCERPWTKPPAICQSDKPIRQCSHYIPGRVWTATTKTCKSFTHGKHRVGGWGGGGLAEIWPRPGWFGELNSSPHSWTLPSVSVDSSPRSYLIETFRFEDEESDEDDYEYEIWLKVFFAYSLNIDSPGSFILPYLTRKVSSVIFSEGGYALSRSQNDKTSTIWYLVSATSTFSIRLVVEWRRLPRFPAKMTLVHARALLITEEISYSS